jgi:glutamate synthase domain-containing protein 3
MVVPVSEARRVAPRQVPVEHTGAADDSYYFDKPAEERALPQAIHNYDRSVGAGLSGELMRRRIHNTSNDDGEIVQAFEGAAGQSFGAFLADGVSLKLNGGVASR